jgi:hypothetical protein
VVDPVGLASKHLEAASSKEGLSAQIRTIRRIRDPASCGFGGAKTAEAAMRLNAQMADPADMRRLPFVN